MFSGVFTLAEKPCISPRQLHEEFQSNGWDSSAFYQKANSYRLFAGGKPADGLLLMRRSDLKALTTDAPPSTRALFHKLVIGFGSEAITLEGVVISRASKVGQYAEDDPEAAYIVKVTDWKEVARSIIAYKQFNVRLRNDPNEAYANLVNTIPDKTRLQVLQELSNYFTTAASGITNTGIKVNQETKQLFEEIVTSINLVSFPETIPDDYPENLRYLGVPVWDAMCDVMFRAGWMLIEDPSDPAVNVNVARMSAATPTANIGYIVQAELTTAGTRSVKILDAEPVSINPFVPEKVEVYFRRVWNGPNETREISAPFHKKEYSLSDYITAAGRTATDFSTIPMSRAAVHDDLEAVMAVDVAFNTGTGVAGDPVNVAKINERAKIAGKRFYQSLDWTLRERKAYYGAQKFWPCEMISETVWHDLGEGIETEYSSLPVEPFYCSAPNRKEFEVHEVELSQELEDVSSDDANPTGVEVDAEIRSGKGDAGWKLSGNTIKVVSRNIGLYGNIKQRLLVMKLSGEFRAISPGFPVYLGYTSVLFEKGTTAEINLMRGVSELNLKGSEIESGHTAMVYNRFADIKANGWLLFTWVETSGYNSDDPPVFKRLGYECIAGECA